MSNYIKLTEKGIYNKQILSEALWIQGKLMAAKMALIQINKPADSPPFQMPSPTLQNPSLLQRKMEKKREVEELTSTLEKAQFDIQEKISNLSLETDKEKLLCKCFVELLKREQAFVDCNMSKSEGYRQLNHLLNEMRL